MSEINLKKCPFCGYPADISRVYALGGKYQNYYTVFCTNVNDCTASVDGEVDLDEGEAKASVIERWNRRDGK